MLAVLVLCLLASSFARNQLPLLEQEFVQYLHQFDQAHLLSNEVEYQYRFKVFQQSQQRIADLNANSKHAKFALNKFALLTPEEFKSQKLGQTISAQTFAQACLAKGVDKSLNFPLDVVEAVPDAWDWRTTGGRGGKGVVTAVKDQGSCGSCWTFSTTGAIESQWALKGNELTQFSEQVIVGCSHGCSNISGQAVCNAGCDGGFQWNAFLDIMSWGGLVTESAYPYTGETGTCNMPAKNQFMAPIKNYTCLSGPDPANEQQLMTYMYQHGPVSIALDAGLLQFYFGGIVDPFFPNLECDPNSLDHALLIVGWGQEANWVGQMTPYWIVKNSWGADWGESGYFLIARNLNICGIANAVCAPYM